MVLAAIADDLSDIFSTDDFAVTATFTPSGGSAVSVDGIFDDGDVEADGGDGVVWVHETKFTCTLSLVSGVADGDALVVNSTNYTVRYVKDDGTGVVELFLEKP